VLGLRWEDIDFDAGTIKVRQQLQRIRGELLLAPVKTNAGKRDLPLLDLVRDALKLQEDRQTAYRTDMGSAWPNPGWYSRRAPAAPIEPRHLVRSSRRIRAATTSGSSRPITCATRSARCSRI
jgi:integrase